MPPITLYFLQASRCIRIAWLLEELGLDYIVVFSDREEVTGLAPQLLKDKTNHYHKKFPTLKDGDLTIVESGAIAE
jgi:glutathione S-transferase